MQVLASASTNIDSDFQFCSFIEIKMLSAPFLHLKINKDEILLLLLQVHSMELRTLPACLLPRPKSENNFASEELTREGRRIFHKSDTFHKDSYQ